MTKEEAQIKSEKHQNLVGKIFRHKIFNEQYKVYEVCAIQCPTMENYHKVYCFFKLFPPDPAGPALSDEVDLFLNKHSPV